jgi:amidophosphoribosyltransferase
MRDIHNIENAQFRSKFESDITEMYGNWGIGVISDYEDQPLFIRSHLGKYAIVTVGAIKNSDEIVKNAFETRPIHFSEMSVGEINPTELAAALINQEATFEEGIQNAQETIEGSCSLLLLTDKGVYAARDRLGRTPVVIGEKEGSFAATLETCAFPNLGFEINKYLGPGEIVFITEEGVEQIKSPEPRMQICGFLWVYYGYPASSYEGINVESVRNKCGALLAKNDTVEIDMVTGIPDSGVGHGLGYAHKAGLPFKRPFVKYTPTWPRSFMPQDQTVRDLVAKMKLIPIRDLMKYTCALHVRL